MATAANKLIADAIRTQASEDENREILSILEKRAAGATLTPLQQAKLDNYEILNGDDPPRDIFGNPLPLMLKNQGEADSLLNVPHKTIRRLRKQKHQCVCGNRLFSGLLHQAIQEDAKLLYDIPTVSGRKPKLTEEITGRIAQKIIAGNFFETAALASGVPERSFYNWKKRGENAKSGIYWQFWQSIKVAEAIREERLVKNIQDAAPTEWRAALAMLKATSKGRFSETHKIEATGKDGTPLAASAPVVNVFYDRGEKEESPFKPAKEA